MLVCSSEICSVANLTIFSPKLAAFQTLLWLPTNLKRLIQSIRENARSTLYCNLFPCMLLRLIAVHSSSTISKESLPLFPLREETLVAAKVGVQLALEDFSLFNLIQHPIFKWMHGGVTNMQKTGLILLTTSIGKELATLKYDLSYWLTSSSLKSELDTVLLGCGLEALAVLGFAVDLAADANRSCKGEEPDYCNRLTAITSQT